MNIREFTKPVTSKTLNESLSARFGKKIDLGKFTLEQLQDVRNKIRTKLFSVETNESFDSVHNETYQKSKMMLDVLNAAISERGDIEDESLDEGIISEGAEDQAELVMAAKDMVDRVTGWMEDTAEMQTEAMLELADAIRDEMGQAAADAFTNTVKPSLDSLYSALESTRGALTSSVGQLTGESEPVDTMGADDDMDDMSDMEPTVDGDMELDVEVPAEDDFAASEPATGGADAAGRAKRESIDRSRKLGQILSKKKLSENVDTNKLYQVLVLLKDKGFSQFNVRQLDRYMRNMGNQQFDYETFKAAYDSDNKIKSIVKDFDKETITLKTSEVDDLKTTKHKKKNTVSNMAKKAVDLKGL